MAKASLPAQSVEFPSLISDDGLVVSRIAERGGTLVAMDMRDWPAGTTVRRQVGEAVAQLVGPVGRWRQKDTIDKAGVGIKVLLSWLEAEAVTDLSKLTVDNWGSWKDYVETRFASTTAFSLVTWSKTVLGASDAVKPSVRWSIRERQGHLKRPDTQPAYTRSEFDDLTKKSMQTVWKAHRRITRNHRLALLDTAGLPDGVKRRAAAYGRLLAGETPKAAWGAAGAGEPDVHVAVGTRLTLHHLTLTAEEVLAAYVLMTCLEGFNSSTLERLELGDESASMADEERLITAELDKPRRGEKRFFTNIWTGRTARAYTLIKEATEPAREILRNRGLYTQLLFVYSSHARLPKAADYMSHDIMSGIPKARSSSMGGGARYSSQWLPEGVSVDFQKLHRTFQTVINRAPTHNSRRTHTQAYLALSDTARTALNVVARKGFQAALDRADQTVLLRLSADEDAPAEVHTGLLDTATVACKDIEHHPVTGTVCTDNFLMCLMCPNAIATQRHLPRLVLFHEVLTDLRSAVSQTAWNQWEADFLRLTAFLEREVRLTGEQRLLSLRKVTDEDHKHVRALLNGTYDFE